MEYILINNRFTIMWRFTFNEHIIICKFFVHDNTLKLLYISSCDVMVTQKKNKTRKQQWCNGTRDGCLGLHSTTNSSQGWSSAVSWWLNGLDWTTLSVSRALFAARTYMKFCEALVADGSNFQTQQFIFVPFRVWDWDCGFWNGAHPPHK